MRSHRTSKAGATGLEPAASGVTGRRSNQLSYAPGGHRFYGPWVDDDRTRLTGT
jgi:hypothetical protein